MNINKKDLDRHFWYEDINGNIQTQTEQSVHATDL